MAVTTFQEKLVAAGARLGSYRGAETAVSFGDTAGEFRALLQDAALYDMGWQTKLVFSGEDRVRWMNGMVTNNIRDLGLNRGGYNFALNAQGRNLGDLTVYNRGDYLLATTEREQVAKLKELFERYIIMDDVEVGDISDKLGAIGVAGPKSAEVLRQAGLEVAALQPGEVVDVAWRGMGVTVARSVLPAMDSYEIWFAAEQSDAVWDALAGAGAKAAGSEALELYRIARGVPRYGVDLRERDLPQETGQSHALNFAKGCYIGQEIVERIRARGNVHRAFVGFEGAAEAGAKVSFGGKEVGEITSAAAAPFPGGERKLALGYIRREAGEPGTEVEIGGAKAVVRALPFE